MKLYDVINNTITTSVYSTDYGHECNSARIDNGCTYSNIQVSNNDVYAGYVTKYSYSEEDKLRIQDEIKIDNSVKDNYMWARMDYYMPEQVDLKPLEMEDKVEVELPFEFTEKNCEVALPCLNNLNAKYFHKRINKCKIAFPLKSTVQFKNGRFVGFLSMLDNVRFYFSKDPSGNSMLLKHNGQLLFTLEEFFDVLKSREYTIE